VTDGTLLPHPSFSPLPPNLLGIRGEGAEGSAIAANGHRLYIKAGNYGIDKLPTLPRMTKALRLFNWLNTGLSRIGQP